MTRFGWRGPGLPDQRDVAYSYGARLADPNDMAFQRVFPSPMVVDLIKGPITNQAGLGSCGPFSLTSNMVATDEQNTGNPKNLSQLFLYYRYRERFGHVEYDDGVHNRELIKVAAEDGVCLEEDWPYILADWKTKPPPETYEKAKLNKIKSYHALYTLDDMIQCIAAGYGFFGGVVWYESADSLYTETTGLIEYPPRGKVLGGHDLFFTQYDKHKRRFGGPNSWGREWGVGGLFSIPFDYLASPWLSGDFWTVRG